MEPSPKPFNENRRTSADKYGTDLNHADLATRITIMAGDIAKNLDFTVGIPKTQIRGINGHSLEQITKKLNNH